MAGDTGIKEDGSPSVAGSTGKSGPAVVRW